MGKEIQTHFLTTVSPAHHGKQGYLHQDKHLHLADPYGNIVKSSIAQNNHVPLNGQTTLNDFTLQKKKGI